MCFIASYLGRGQAVVRSHILAIMDEVITVHGYYISMIATYIPLLILIGALECLHLIF